MIYVILLTFGTGFVFGLLSGFFTAGLAWGARCGDCAIHNGRIPLGSLKGILK